MVGTVHTGVLGTNHSLVPPAASRRDVSGRTDRR